DRGGRGRALHRDDARWAGAAAAGEGEGDGEDDEEGADGGRGVAATLAVDGLGRRAAEAHHDLPRGEGGEAGAYREVGPPGHVRPDHVEVGEEPGGGRREGREDGADELHRSGGADRTRVPFGLRHGR